MLEEFSAIFSCLPFPFLEFKWNENCLGSLSWCSAHGREFLVSDTLANRCGIPFVLSPTVRQLVSKQFCSLFSALNFSICILSRSLHPPVAFFYSSLLWPLTSSRFVSFSSPEFLLVFHPKLYRGWNYLSVVDFAFAISMRHRRDPRDIFSLAGVISLSPSHPPVPHLHLFWLSNHQRIDFALSLPRSRAQLFIQTLANSLEIRGFVDFALFFQPLDSIAHSSRSSWLFETRIGWFYDNAPTASMRGQIISPFTKGNLVSFCGTVTDPSRRSDLPNNAFFSLSPSSRSHILRKWGKINKILPRESVSHFLSAFLFPYCWFIRKKVRTFLPSTLHPSRIAREIAAWPIRTAVKVVSRTAGRELKCKKRRKMGRGCAKC